MSAGSGFHSLFFSGGSGQHCPWMPSLTPLASCQGWIRIMGLPFAAVPSNPSTLRLVRVRGGGKALLWAVCLPPAQRGKGPCWTCLCGLK